MYTERNANYYWRATSFSRNEWIEIYRDLSRTITNKAILYIFF